LDSKSCTACHADCATCDGATNDKCLTCSDSTKKLYSGACKSEPTCKTAEFINANGECTACHADCATCDGATASSCLSCVAPNKFLNAKACTACHADCATCDGATASSCLSCVATNKFLNAKACTACHADCATCDGATNDKCLTCSDSSKKAYKGVCKTIPTCKANEFINDNGECVACDVTCKTCSGAGASQCTDCESPRTLQTGQCVLPGSNGASSLECKIIFVWFD